MPQLVMRFAHNLQFDLYRIFCAYYPNGQVVDIPAFLCNKLDLIYESVKLTQAVAMGSVN